jgi:hypothetical protein
VALRCRPEKLHAIFQQHSSGFFDQGINTGRLRGFAYKMSAQIQDNGEHRSLTLDWLRHTESNDGNTQPSSKLLLKLSTIVRVVVGDGSIHGVLFELIRIYCLATITWESAQLGEVAINQGIKLRKDNDDRDVADVSVEEELLFGGQDRSVRMATNAVPGTRRG